MSEPVTFKLIIFHPFIVSIFFFFILLFCVAFCGPETCMKLRFDSAKPLFLTPYLENGRSEKARQAAQVLPLLGDIKSFSGFITVDGNHNRNLFFWYFPVENSSGVLNAPVVLWLQGGPGESAMNGLLNQHGPFYLGKDGNVFKRTHRWCRHFHMLYIDSPAGTGFSFVNDKNYLTNRDEAGADLYEALTQFFKIFPELGEKEFFIAGESYAGKFIPALGRIIHRKNKLDSVKINLKGLLIGNGMIDPEFLTYGKYLTQVKIIKTQDLPDWLDKEEKFRNALQQKDQQLAEKTWSEIQRKLKENISTNIYNYREKTRRNSTEEDRVLKEFLSKKEVRLRLHVGNTDFKPFNDEVNSKMSRDFYTKISPYTEELLENYRVLHYNGDVDVTLHYQMMENYANNLKWSGSKDYQSAESFPWRVNGEIAGYVKSGGNLTVAVVRNAGHSVPKDQPEWALDLVTRFIRNRPISSLK